MTVTARAPDAFEIVAHRWRGAEGCIGRGATRVRRVVVLPALTTERVRVGDAAAGGTLSLSVALHGGSPSCASAVEQCSADCQCQASDPRARCLTFGSPPVGRVCGRSCSEDVDCDSDQRCDTGYSFSCTSLTAFHANEDCLPGQIAIDGRCQPTPSERRACGCDGQCAAGQLCTGGECRSTCVTERDCGPGFACVGLCSAE